MTAKLQNDSGRGNIAKMGADVAQHRIENGSIRQLEN
jgi:hypothetical protein